MRTGRGGGGADAWLREGQPCLLTSERLPCKWIGRPNDVFASGRPGGAQRIGMFCGRVMLVMDKAVRVHRVRVSGKQANLAVAATSRRGGHDDRREPLTVGHE